MIKQIAQPSSKLQLYAFFYTRRSIIIYPIVLSNKVITIPEESVWIFAC